MMKRLVLGLSAVAVLAGCSSSSGGDKSVSPAPSSSEGSSAGTTAPGSTTAGLGGSACDIFERFFEDLNKYTPHDQVRLNADLDGIVRAATDEGDPQLVDDVTALVAHVGSNSWPNEGTPIDPEILAVEKDCT